MIINKLKKKLKNVSTYLKFAQTETRKDHHLFTTRAEY